MREGQPSRTAMGAALLRALHQDLDRPLVFEDPLAWAVLGVDRAAALEAAQPQSRLRLFVAHRHAYADATLAAAYTRGVRQCVVLGAGLDTTAHRNRRPDLAVFEVDHPDTQDWKRARVAAAGLTGAVTYVPVDLERSSLLDPLAAAGFAASSPAVFVWLGVVPYLTRPAVRATLAAVATVPGAEVVLDHVGTSRDAAGSARLEALSENVAELGEAFTAPWATGEMAELLASLGFADFEELDLPPGGGGHIVRARRPG